MTDTNLPISAFPLEESANPVLTASLALKG